MRCVLLVCAVAVAGAVRPWLETSQRNPPCAITTFTTTKILYRTVEPTCPAFTAHGGRFTLTTPGQLDSLTAHGGVTRPIHASQWTRPAATIDPSRVFIVGRETIYY